MARNTRQPGAPARRTQTTRINGKRVVVRTSTSGKVSVADAPPLEWELQAAQVAALRRLPEYGKAFLLAGDMNASKRGPKAQAQAVATGMTAGEPDLRIYLRGGKVRFIENKTATGRLSTAQKSRQEALQRLGHHVAVVGSATTQNAASEAVRLVLKWVAENDNEGGDAE